MDEDVAMGDSGSLISQSYSDLTYFAEDYVADTRSEFFLKLILILINKEYHNN